MFFVISGISLPVLCAVERVMRAIYSKRFLDDLLYTNCVGAKLNENIKSNFTCGYVFSIFSFGSSSVLKQIGLYLTVKNLLYFFDDIPNIGDIVKEGLLIYFASLFLYFFVELTLKMISWIWRFVKKKLFSEFENDYQDEYDSCWGLQAKNEFSAADFFEILHVFGGLVAALYLLLMPFVLSIYITNHKIGEMFFHPDLLDICYSFLKPLAFISYRGQMEMLVPRNVTTIDDSFIEKN